MAVKKALIFGATGQAGSYLAEFLLAKGYEVHGTIRYQSQLPANEKIYLHMIEFPTGQMVWLGDALLREVQPDEVYNLASPMFAPRSWAVPIEYLDIAGVVVARILDSICRHCPKARFFQAGSAEVFLKDGKIKRESSVVRPDNPYGLAKAQAQELVRIYREQKGLFATTGILFNMESMRRPSDFFAQKVVWEALRLKEEWDPIGCGVVKKAKFGKLSAIRDWGLTKEYVEAMWLMLQSTKEPKDYIIATGHSHTCRTFLVHALKAVGIEHGMSALVDFESESNDSRRADAMWADPRLIAAELGWTARTSKLSDIVSALIEEAKEVECRRVNSSFAHSSTRNLSS